MSLAGQGWGAGYKKAVVFLLKVMATVHVVLFYLIRVPSFLNLDLYERGLEKMPFQGRILMMYPLRWAHTSIWFQHTASWLTSLRMWLPRVVVPEDVAEFGIDLLAVVVAGVTAQALYRRRSSKGRLLPYVYPVFLVMVTGSYCLPSIHFFRYVYDLPSLGLFAACLYFCYRRDRTFLFSLLFVLATLNRETSILLLFFFVENRCVNAQRFTWKPLLRPAVGGVAAALSVFWLCFHVWLSRRFGVPPQDGRPGLLANLMVLAWPYAWPQLAGIGGYVLPLLVLFRPKHMDRNAYTWMWLLPFWAALTFFYGSLAEIRLYGELLPLFACTAVLTAEEQLFGGNT